MPERFFKISGAFSGKKLVQLGLCLLLLQGCSPVALAKQTFTFELGSDVYSKALYYLKDAGQYSDNMKVVCREDGIREENGRFVYSGLNYLPVGIYDFAIESSAKTLSFRIKIKDTKPPGISEPAESIVLDSTQEPDWQQIFQAQDLSGVSYEVLDEKTEDTGILYHVKISDRFGNSVTRRILVEYV